MIEIKARYVLINAECGSVTWYDSYIDALRDKRQYGGTLINTEIADREYVERCVENARRNP